MSEQKDKCPECGNWGTLPDGTMDNPKPDVPCPTCNSTGEKKGKIECAFEDWDDTTLPQPVCHCLKREGIDCANVPNDVEACPDFMSKKDKLREKIAIYFCEEIDEDYYTPLGKNVGNSFADYTIALIEPLIEEAKKQVAYWREKCWNDTMSAKASGWDDCVKFYGIKEE